MKSINLIRHPEATFYGKVEGDSMEDAGIKNGDIEACLVQDFYL